MFNQLFNFQSSEDTIFEIYGYKIHLFYTIPIFLIISGYQSAHALFIPILSRLNKILYMVKDDLHQAGAGFGACPGDMWRDE